MDQMLIRPFGSKINDWVKAYGCPGLLQFIPCNLHVVHNSFKKGLKVYGSEAKDLAVDLFFFFKSSPCKREDFKEVESSLGFDEELFIRHVQTRWLTLLPALARIVKNWEPLVKYFLTELPKTAAASKTLKLVESNPRYIRICRTLKSPSVLVQMNFLLGLTPLFDRFLKFFQREDPLVHILFSEMKDLLKSFMLRFLKSSTVDGLKTGKILLEFNVEKSDSQLIDIEVSQGTEKLLKENPGLVTKEKIGMKKFYTTVTKYLQKKLPLNNDLLRARINIHPLDWAMGKPGGLSGNCILILILQQHADEVLTADMLIMWIY